MDLFPAIDLRNGKCVRLHQGDYGQETVYGDDPVAQALAFAASRLPALTLTSSGMSSDALTPEVLTAAWPSCSKEPPADDPSSPAPTETSMTVSPLTHSARPPSSNTHPYLLETSLRRV